MSSGSSVIFPDTLRSIDVATVTSVAYSRVGPPLDRSLRIVKFTNASDTTCILSWDGVLPHEVFPPNSFVLLDVSTNQETSRIFEIQQGTQFFLTLLNASGTGSFYISCYFGG